jgi:FixJ family two-component response regulator
MYEQDPTVFIIDDDPVICDALTWLLQSVKINSETYDNGQAYLDVYDVARHGCILLDIRMPQMGGFELLKELSKRQNQLPIIFITGHGDVPMAVRAMQEGAMDFVLKPFNDQLLLEKVQKAIVLDQARGQQHMSVSHPTDPLVQKRFNQLTRREKQVMKLVAGGKLNKQIAAELHISESTVEYHRSNVMRKLEVKSLAELIKLTVSYQLV